jgi:plastocyanin
MRRRAFLAGAGAAGVALLAGCTATGLSDDEFDVEMYSNRFDPVESEATAGDEVVWGNTGSRPHTVTAYDDGIPEDAAYFASGGFDSQDAAEANWPDQGGIASGETYSHTFETPGRYDYYCIPHLPAGMEGTVIVSE